MKALQIEKFGGPEVMKLADVPVPEPGPGEARIRVEAGGLNYSDIMIREGTYIDATTLPHRLGREFCGTIDKLGPGVAGWSVGQRVVGAVQSGAFAEYVAAPVETLIPCPEGITPEQGAAILVAGITAVHCLDDCGRLAPGETVLIHAAAGGVGTLAVQIARAEGANVIGTASSDEKCRFIAGLGATPVNYAKGDWVKEVRSLTQDRGADLILESVGGEVYRRSFKEALAVFGRMVVFGVATREMVPFNNREILESNRTLTGYYLGAYFPAHLDRVINATMKLVGLILEGKVKPIVGKSVPLDQAVEAFNHMQQRKNIGKVVLRP
jgi:NADPH2:quinone reductase